MRDAAVALLERFADAVGIAAGAVEFRGDATLASAYPVSDLAAASIGVAGLAASRLLADGVVVVHRELADGWFGSVCVPVDGTDLPSPWDPIAANYRTRDGWIRLHTNASAHRSAALRALSLDPDPDGADARDRERVATAVSGWQARHLEDAVVAAGGAAAELRTAAEWAEHPQGRAVASEPLVARELSAGGRAPGAGSADRPLAGVRVLDLTRVLAGPTATQFLAGLGANVLRIDPSDWDETAVLPHVMSGKRSARLDLRSPEGARRIRELLAGADVLVHGLRPGALGRLGLDPDARDRIRPGLVDVSLDAYGWTGPWADRRAFDSVVQLSSGIAYAGSARAPAPLPVQALDVATGYLVAAAALAALGRVRAGGPGERMRLSLARTAVELERTRGLVETGELRRAAVATTAGLPREPIESGWGPLARLAPPLELPGAALLWYLPPGPLGGDVPAW